MPRAGTAQHGRKPAATAADSSAKNTRCRDVAAARDGPQGAGAVEAAIDPAAAGVRRGCRARGLGYGRRSAPSSVQVRRRHRRWTWRRPRIRHAAASIDSSSRLASTPPRYWPMDPSLRTTRWQGTMSGRGLVRHAEPTARAARGLPAASATSP